MRVQLAWVSEDEQVLFRWLEVPEQARLGEALAVIDDPRLREGLTAGRLIAAVYGELRQASEPLSPGDRIELVEGLRADPKIARQRRVAVRRSQVARGKGQGGRKD
jgi:putative ubiquitin-RnfH superfamily antitoxin RatB of RatAB toxin-antitoxin module